MSIETGKQDLPENIEFLRKFAATAEVMEFEEEKKAGVTVPSEESAMMSIPDSPQPEDAKRAHAFPTDEARSWHGSMWVPNTKHMYLGILDHGMRPETRGVVIHVNDGYYQGTIDWFSGGSEGVGAHFEIGSRQDGPPVQFLPLDRKAWHAVEANAFTIGIEHAGFGTKRDWEKEDMLKYSADRCAWILHRFNLGPPSHGHNIWPHSHGGNAWGGHFDCPGANFPWSRYLEMVGTAYHHNWSW